MSQRRRIPVGPVVGTAVGVPVLGYGVWGLLHDSALTHPSNAVTWIVGANAVVDLMLLPLLVGVSFLATRPLPAWTRPPVRLGMAISAVLAIVAWPEIADYGDERSNPSLLPRDEMAGLLAYLAVVWSAVAVILARRARSTRAVSGRGGGG